jgi:hypothetical protein
MRTADDLTRTDGEWPSLRVDEWTATRDTLHMWTQIIGKIRLAEAPMINHWWQVPLYVTPTGLTTSAIPYGRRLFDISFDFQDHLLRVRESGGAARELALAPMAVADFYARTMAMLVELGIEPAIRPVPSEVEQAIPFAEDHEHASYRPEHARLFWRQLVQAHRVITDFRSYFIGKVSPVHVFWGGLDLACSRFSGRPAPRYDGAGAPNCPNWVNVEAYSHELSSCGFWAGGGEEGAFYSYAYPEPQGYPDYRVEPEAAFYSRDFNQFLLPYEAVRTAPDPERTLLDFLHTTYAAAADLGHWDRAALEDDPGRRASPR